MKLPEDIMNPIAFGEPTHWYLNILATKNTRTSCEQLKQQILENQEKAEKWDELQHGISQMKSYNELDREYIKKLENVQNFDDLCDTIVQKPDNFGKMTIGPYFANLMNENKQFKIRIEQIKDAMNSELPDNLIINLIDNVILRLNKEKSAQ